MSHQQSFQKRSKVTLLQQLCEQAWSTLKKSICFVQHSTLNNSK